MDIINNHMLHFETYNWKREVTRWKEKFEVRFQWINRKGNKVAEKLAKQTILNDQNFMFHYYVPMMISHDLHNDYVSSYSS